MPSKVHGSKHRPAGRRHQQHRVLRNRRAQSRVQVPVNLITRSGIGQPNQTTADTYNQHYIAGNDGQVFLEIVSSDAGTQNVQFLPSSTLDSDTLGVQNLTVSVTAGATVVVGPWHAATFAQNTSNDLWFNASASTLKFRAFRLVPTP